MRDYFYECVNARGELAGTRAVLENLIKSLTEMKENDIFCEVSIKLGRKRLIEIDAILERTIGEYVEHE